MVHEFKKSFETGKLAEKYAEKYFIKHNYKYKDVRNNPEYWKIDIDYIVNGETYEVKQNYHNAIYGRKGNYFWVELSVGDKQGFWYKSKADYFLFFNSEGSGILIQNNEAFKNIVTGFIKNGDHSKEGNNRIDIIKDQRHNNIIEVSNMRIYVEDLLNTGVNMNKIVNRRKNAA